MKNIFSLMAPRINPNDDEMLFHGYSIKIGEKINKGDIIATAETSKSWSESIIRPCRMKSKHCSTSPCPATSGRPQNPAM